MTTVATYGYTKTAAKQRHNVLKSRENYSHLMMKTALNLKSAVMATKCRGQRAYVVLLTV